jgi:hypothetical protein
MNLSADLHGSVQKALVVEAWRALSGDAATAAAGERATAGEPGAGGEGRIIYEAGHTTSVAWSPHALGNGVAGSPRTPPARYPPAGRPFSTKVERGGQSL